MSPRFKNTTCSVELSDRELKVLQAEQLGVALIQETARTPKRRKR